MHILECMWSGMRNFQLNTSAKKKKTKEKNNKKLKGHNARLSNNGKLWPKLLSMFSVSNTFKLQKISEYFTLCDPRCKGYLKQFPSHLQIL